MPGRAAPQPTKRPAPRAAASSSRPAGRPLNAPPPLAQLADDRAAELGDLAGGVCPRCQRARRDTDRNCPHCGTLMRRECGKCHQPEPDESIRFCTGCGTELAAPLRARPANAPPDPPGDEFAPAAIAPPAELVDDAAGKWDASDMALFTLGVDALLVKLKAEPMKPDECKKLQERFAAVVNKHFRAGGRWKEEIQLATALGATILPAVYVYAFVLPEREKRAELAAAAPPAPAAPRAVPNLEAVS